MPASFVASLLAVGLLSAGSDGPRHLAVSCRLVEGSPATVEISSQNASDRALEAHVTASLWLTAVPATTDSSRPSVLVTAFDPKTGASEGLFETPPLVELPVGGSVSIELDLTRLPWSLSPKDVDAPRELWQLDARGEYDVRVVVWSDPAELLRFPKRSRFPFGCCCPASDGVAQQGHTQFLWGRRVKERGRQGAAILEGGPVTRLTRMSATAGSGAGSCG